ncbi:hypothetical protein HAX54_034307 [Datura stramonium]|uniref:Uncharacterized protein n=1 Tax=Datura stramonium TaxID=4076 RepID=A0ABS8VEJ1_DATST|nr:hypothetical protein [Datura stramonium]
MKRSLSRPPPLHLPLLHCIHCRLLPSLSFVHFFSAVRDFLNAALQYAASALVFVPLEILLPSLAHTISPPSSLMQKARELGLGFPLKAPSILHLYHPHGGKFQFTLLQPMIGLYSSRC